MIDDIMNNKNINIKEYLITINNEFYKIKDNIFEHKSDFEKFIIVSSAFLDNVKKERLGTTEEIDSYNQLVSNFDKSITFLDMLNSNLCKKKVNFLESRLDNYYLSLFDKKDVDHSMTL